MAEHHIHVHIHGQQPDNNEVALQALASAGKQAAAQVAPAGWGSVGTDTGDQTQGTNTPVIDQYAAASTLAAAILAGAIIGRKHRETSKETAVEVAKELVDLILLELSDPDGPAQDVVAVAHIAAGYLFHGRGVYQKQTIAERAVEAYRLI